MSSKFDWSGYTSVDQIQAKSAPAKETTTANAKDGSFSWDSFKAPEEDSTLKSIGRSIYQPIAGALSKLTYPANIVQMIGQGEALSEYSDLEERIPELQKLFPNAPWENFKGLDKEKYMEAVQAAGDIFPTQQNIERGVESLTGLPLTPQNKAQELLRMGGAAAAFRPGSIGEKATAAIATPIVKEGLDIAGVPEPISEIAAYGIGGLTPTPSISKAAPKGSGLATRGFEKLTKNVKVGPDRFTAITEAVENDFKGIADKMLDESMTFRAMKENPTEFKNKVSNLFDDVSKLSENVEGTVDAGKLRSDFRRKMNSRDKVGISPDQYEKSYLKEARILHKDIPEMGDLSAKQLVEQYRKNNKTLTEIFEPGKSRAFNRAKADALVDYNRSIAELIESKYPDTEFSKLFKFSNKRWSEIKDIEAIKSFNDSLFEGKIKYEKGANFYKNNRVSAPFKRILGEEKFKEYTNLMDDLMSQEQAYKYVKKAEAGGLKDFAKDGLAFLVSPQLAKAKFALKLGQQLHNSLLDKPQIIVKWKSAIDSVKKSDFKRAGTLFTEIKKDINE